MINNLIHILDTYSSNIDLIFLSQLNFTGESCIHPSLHPSISPTFTNPAITKFNTARIAQMCKCICIVPVVQMHLQMRKLLFLIFFDTSQYFSHILIETLLVDIKTLHALQIKFKKHS